MPRADEKTIQDFYYFWKWEYTRRNVEYKEKFEFEMETYDEIMVHDQLAGESMFAFGEYLIELSQLEGSQVLPESIFYRSSDDVIKAIITNKFEYKRPFCLMLPKNIEYSSIFEEFYKEIIESNCFTSGMKKLVSLLSENPEKDIRICIVDFSKPVEDIIDDIKKIYTMKAYVENRGHHREIRNDLMAHPKNDDEISRLPKGARDLPRAVGLWLWDYVDSKKIQWEHRAKSYAAFHLKFQNPKRPDCFVDKYNKSAQLADLLDKTRQCIEGIKVLPMG